MKKIVLIAMATGLHRGCDSDGSPKGRDGEAGSIGAADESAGRKASPEKASQINHILKGAE